MPKLVQLNDISFLNNLSNFGQINLSKTQKVIIISVCAGATLLGVVSQYMKRRKTTNLFLRSKKNVNSIQPSVSPRHNSPEEEPCHAGSPLRTLQRQSSVLSTFSEKLSAAGLSADLAKLTPQQLGVMDVRQYQHLESGS